MASKNCPGFVNVKFSKIKSQISDWLCTDLWDVQEDHFSKGGNNLWAACTNIWAGFPPEILLGYGIFKTNKFLMKLKKKPSFCLF
jgi:hypothetical protein